MEEVIQFCKIAVSTALAGFECAPIERGIRVEEGPLKGYVVTFSKGVKSEFERIAHNSAYASIVVTRISQVIRNDAAWIGSTNQAHLFSGIKVYRTMRTKTIKAALIETSEAQS
ncbi:hypothetical protein [Paraburkholderia tropica]|uniref:hypothetical protein n=1 Tax=Paraburkholderia tropica TaxID=92647 RepID=UPI002AB7C0E8|nr:hypothetical protein [Paraburkholderia tropica]